MNRVDIIGRIVRDIKTESSTNGTTYLRNAIAVDRRGKNETDFFNVTAFGKTAEFLERYFKKGSKVAISGHLQSDSYTDKNGNKVTSVSIIVDEVDFCESKGDKPSNLPENEFVNVPEGLVEELPFN